MKEIAIKILFSLVLFLFLGINAQSSVPIDTRALLESTTVMNDIEIKEDAKGKYVEIENHNWKGNSIDMIVQKYKALPIVLDMEIKDRVTTVYFALTEKDDKIKRFIKKYF